MIPNSDATTVQPQPTQPPAPSGPPQRQSCDRCHRQKLRCIRNKNNNGGACDRCLSKRAQCVYSLSLPKGRPSLHRLLTEEANTISNTATRGETAKAPEATRPASKGRPLSAASTPAKPLPVSTEPAASSAMPRLMDTSMDMSVFTWPWLDTTGWDDTQPEMGWGSSMNFSRTNVDDVLATAHSFEGDASTQDPFSETHSPSSPNPSDPHTYAHRHPGLGNYDRQGSLGEGTIGMYPDKHGSLAIAQLTQLSVHLSTLRASSYNLAQAADLSSGHLPTDPYFPLIDSAAFESVAAWLAHEQRSANLDSHLSIHMPEIPNPWPNSGPPKPQSGPNILRDVFSASHRLIEILRHLQVDDISRHLVMACEALLLEIYAAILTALQHEAYPADSMSGTALGNVRLVLVVQLCAYLIERQHQAVDQCLSPALAQKHNLSTTIPSEHFQLGTVHRECLKNLKINVQQKLTHLRQMLRCT
ncbi:hypothetical protein CC78DRAFT_117692 [Lojkania enalia]|uniref:Zn(2)-C6 fungal-type domain-containing protein n=1 Tax=Lojkania enalia TaxID=147567 RepID=A0A9P4K1E8_9PLEO|nr:hypothetical protein CC78DRAFT_117692 [Didymosphaeria enalia]